MLIKEPVLVIVEREFSVESPAVRAAKRLRKAGFNSNDLRGEGLEDTMRISVQGALRDLEIKEEKKILPKKKGRKKMFSKIEREDIYEIYHSTKMNIAQIARLFRCSPGTIDRIIERTY